jgi:LCP family protein required for cell wall assembly
LKKKIILIIIIPLLVIVAAGVGAYYYVNSKIYVPTPKNIFSTEEEKKAADYVEEQGITNILLVGLDGRKNDADSRTDSMIVASVDSNNKKVKLISFMRDMYVPIPGHGQSRINSAYFLGGSELLMKTLNQDFNLSTQYYVSIDFNAFQALVDKLGGIDVEVKEYELKEINYYIKEANWSNPNNIYLKNAGYQHLNGQQALSYCRIRKVGNNDYGRTERQRRVLGLLIDKARKTSVLKLPELITTLLPYIKTDMPTSKLMSLGYTVYKFGGTKVESLRIPGDGMFDSMVIDGADVLVPNIERNVNLLDKFIFSSGSVDETNMPAYMVNNFHSKDIALDKRGKKKNYVKIITPTPTPTPTPTEVIPPTDGNGQNGTGDNSGTGGDDQGNGTGGDNGSSGGNVTPTPSPTDVPTPTVEPTPTQTPTTTP